jgi:hypothetical protein
LHAGGADRRVALGNNGKAETGGRGGGGGEGGGKKMEKKGGKKRIKKEEGGRLTPCTPRAHTHSHKSPAMFREPAEKPKEVRKERRASGRLLLLLF